MCLNIKQDSVSGYYHPFIAGEDIITFKKVTYTYEDSGRISKIKFKSQHQYFLYESNYQYDVDIFPNRVKRNPLTDRSNGLGKEGLHSWQLRKIKDFDTGGDWGAILIKCVIPKGTRYYIGVRDELLSESLIIKGRIYERDKKRILENLEKL